MEWSKRAIVNNDDALCWALGGFGALGQSCGANILTLCTYHITINYQLSTITSNVHAQGIRTEHFKCSPKVSLLVSVYGCIVRRTVRTERVRESIWYFFSFPRTSARCPITVSESELDLIHRSCFLLYFHLETSGHSELQLSASFTNKTVTDVRIREVRDSMAVLQ